MKSRTRTQHLTDAEFSNLLAGELPDEITRAHLDLCDHCRGEFESVQESLNTFQSMGSRWAESAAPSRIPVPSRWALGLVLRPTWATGFAVTALTGVLAFLHSTPAKETPGPASVAAASVNPSPTNAELANDKRLMVSIDQELGYQSQAGHSSDLRSSTQMAGGSANTVLN